MLNVINLGQNHPMPVAILALDATKGFVHWEWKFLLNKMTSEKLSKQLNKWAELSCFLPTTKTV